MSTAADDDYFEHLRDKAEFCLLTGVQPSEYDDLTDDERNAFVDAANRQAKKG